MSYQSLLESFHKICVLVTFAYLLSRTELFRRLFGPRYHSRDQVWVLLFFSLLSLVEIGLHPEQSPGSFRALAATVAGLLGGPWVGAGVGLFTGLASAVLLGPAALYGGLTTMAGGLLAGRAADYRPHLQMKAVAGFVVGALSHTVWLGLVYAQDTLVGTWDAVALLFGVPILLNGAAAALFLMVIGDMHSHLERIERTELARALRVANRVLPRLKYGMNPQSASYIADIIRRITGADAVCIADPAVVLAYAGEHNGRQGGAPVSDLSREAMRTREVAFTDDGKSEMPGCAAPLFYEEEVVGSVEVYQSSGRRIRPEIAELGQEIAQFLSNYQIQLADLERRSEAASKAELRALQAQVHPHFLFNALNTVASLCETKPRKAGEIAIQLGAYYRTALRRDTGALIPLGDELANVRYYLGIERARFGDRLSVMEAIEDGLEQVLVPVLSLQPLVENAVLHGLSTKLGKGSLKIAVRSRKDRLDCWVTDDGIGISRDQLRDVLNGGSEPHGLTILKNRLDKLYHGRFRLGMRSHPGSGTAVLLSIPLLETDE